MIPFKERPELSSIEDRLTVLSIKKPNAKGEPLCLEFQMK